MGQTKAEKSMEMARKLIEQRRAALLSTIEDATRINVEKVRSEVEKEMPDKELAARISRVAAQMTKLDGDYERKMAALKEEKAKAEKEFSDHKARVEKAIEERTRKIREQSTVLRQEAEETAREAVRKLYYDSLTPSNRLLVEEVPTPEEFVKEKNGIMQAADLKRLDRVAAAD